MATIREIAEYTGFSAATISRVLNNDPTMSVTDATRATILEAASKFHYKPPVKSRRSKRKDMPHIAVAEMLSPAEQLSDPYYLYLKNYAAQYCLDAGGEISYLTEQGGVYRTPSQKRIDGILAIGIFSEEQVEKLNEMCRSMVFLDSSPDEARFDSVVLNLSLGVEQALDYLLSKGHRRIGFLGPNCKLDQKKRPAPEVRRQCFIRYMEERGLLDPELVLDTSADRREMWESMLNRIQDGRAMPTALLSYNEETAINAMGALRKAGLRVPEDISVISFNDTPLSALTEPPLTSVSAHLEDMSACAVKMLFERMKDPQSIPRKMVLPATLVERGSVIPCPVGEE
ncbi:LacI family DNA-binding transcriptional regulator [Pseudoflavonifractor phocaeensis]|uniref:LacI family DNA-binding transcriptional regulator n=1 Tax=Pseudoflavonifractor phocaeensis TaxID=1870988 RepID=UPI00195B583F|nr:LacI family DNA-binding transcriptional regulator [Pseudoflavonifractor phocaeensis]MBM6870942.1 LacI family DNA-binding transcriptional regulator [Pseudoflavonifractor phocaeensis]